jgi:hypothetical protein
MTSAPSHQLQLNGSRLANNLSLIKVQNFFIMNEKYKNLPEDDQVNETFDQQTGKLIYNPYNDEVYKEWQARNLDSNYFKTRISKPQFLTY